SQHEAFACLQFGELAKPAQRPRTGGIYDPEQIEDEQDTKGVVGDDNQAPRCEVRVINVHQLEPSQQRDISSNEHHKACCPDEGPSIQTSGCHRHALWLKLENASTACAVGMTPIFPQ